MMTYYLYSYLKVQGFFSFECALFDIFIEDCWCRWSTGNISLIAKLYYSTLNLRHISIICIFVGSWCLLHCCIALCYIWWLSIELDRKTLCFYCIGWLSICITYESLIFDYLYLRLWLSICITSDNLVFDCLYFRWWLSICIINDDLIFLFYMMV